MAVYRKLVILAFSLVLFPTYGRGSVPDLSNTQIHGVQGLDVFSDKKLDFRFDTATKATVLVFVSARCPCSASHEVALKELARDFSTPEFQFIGIHSNTDESLSMTQSHFKSSGLSFPVIQDEGAVIANEWGALKTPHVFVVSPKGELLYQGGVDDTHLYPEAKKPYLRQALSAIQAGRKPEVALTRSLGCVIRR